LKGPAQAEAKSAATTGLQGRFATNAAQAATRLGAYDRAGTAAARDHPACGGTFRRMAQLVQIL